MVRAGIGVSNKGKHITINSSQESVWLSLILEALKNNSSVIAEENDKTVDFKQYNLLSANQQGLDANTYRTISFQVVLGSVAVSTDGGLTSISYPLGSNVNVNSGGKIIATPFLFTVPGVLSDGQNRILVQATR